MRELSRRDQGRAASGTRAEIAEGQLARGGLIQRPFGRVHQTLREQGDVETMLRRINIDRFLFTGKKIEEQSAEPGAVERSRDELIPRTMPAAPAAMREQNEHVRTLGQSERAAESGCSGLNDNF